MEMQSLAYCGLDCFQCPAYLATKNNDDQLRATTAAQWSAMFQAEIKAEQINCDGCKSGTERKFFHCSQCEIRSCAEGKKYETCAECADFACEKVAFVVDNVPEAKAALEALRKA